MLTVGFLLLSLGRIHANVRPSVDYERRLSQVGTVQQVAYTFRVWKTGQLDVVIAADYLFDGGTSAQGEAPIWSNVTTWSMREACMSNTVNVSARGVNKSFPIEHVNGLSQVKFDLGGLSPMASSSPVTVRFEYVIENGVCNEANGGPKRIYFPWVNAWRPVGVKSTFRIEFPEEVTPGVAMFVCFGASGLQRKCGQQMEISINGNWAQYEANVALQDAFFQWDVPSSKSEELCPLRTVSGTNSGPLPAVCGKSTVAIRQAVIDAWAMNVHPKVSDPAEQVSALSTKKWLVVLAVVCSGCAVMIVLSGCLSDKKDGIYDHEDEDNNFDNGGGVGDSFELDNNRAKRSSVFEFDNNFAIRSSVLSTADTISRGTEGLGPPPSAPSFHPGKELHRDPNDPSCQGSEGDVTRTPSKCAMFCAMFSFHTVTFFAHWFGSHRLMPNTFHAENKIARLTAEEWFSEDFNKREWVKKHFVCLSPQATKKIQSNRASIRASINSMNSQDGLERAASGGSLPSIEAVGRSEPEPEERPRGRSDLSEERQRGRSDHSEYTIPPRPRGMTGTESTHSTMSHHSTGEDLADMAGVALDMLDLGEEVEEGDGTAQEEELIRGLLTAQLKPWFIVCQCIIAFLFWFVCSIMNTLDDEGGTSDPTNKDTTYAGLDTLSPQLFDLIITRPSAEICEDYRSNWWRWITYQFTHGSMTHVSMNCLTNLLYGIPLEGIHGTKRIFVMYNVCVLGGAGCALVNDPHVAVVGMSGGCYGLLGMNWADLVMNWFSKKYRRFQLIMILGLAFIDLVSYMYANNSISHSAHLGGFITGCMIGVVVGQNNVVERWEKMLSAFAVFVGTILIIFCWFWSVFQWPPRDIWETVPWCWARQIVDVANNAVCIRCANQDCIDKWNQASELLKTPLRQVSIEACREQGWYNGR